MNSPYKEQLYTKANEFMQICQRDSFDMQIVVDSLREFGLKISVQKAGFSYGFLNLYYSPKKQQFSLTNNEIKDSKVADYLKEIWENPAKTNAPPSSQVQTKKAQTYKNVSIYVDGSYINGKTGYGAVILDGNKVLKELSGKVSKSEEQGTRQVAGELYATMESIKWCEEHSIQNAKICYDYTGIENWAVGAWKANKPLTQKYKEFIKNSNLRIDWIKVKSHSGNKWNDKADKLAKDAIINA